MMTTGINRFSQGFLNRPPIMESASDCVAMNTKLFRPFNDSLNAPSELKEMAAPRIVGLFGLCGPSAIIRGVRAIIVNAVKGRADWTFAHVFDKVSKAFSPTVANGDSSFSVVMELVIGRVVATLKHVLVDMAQGVVTQAVLPLLCGSKFALETATTCRKTLPQVSSTDGPFCSAGTTAQPVDFLPLLMRERDHLPATKLLAAQIVSHSTPTTGTKSVEQVIRSDDSLCATITAAYPVVVRLFPVRKAQDSPMPEPHIQQVVSESFVSHLTHCTTASDFTQVAMAAI